MAVDVATHIMFMEKLNDSLVWGNIVDTAIVPPAMEMVFRIRKRVSEQGKASDGSQMRSYSTKPIYATRDQFVGGGFIPQGKNNVGGNTIGDVLIPTIRLKKTGVKKNPVKYTAYSLVKPDHKERKSMYLQQGYKELRDVQGLRTDITNMKYRGNLLNDFWLDRDDKGVVTGLTSTESADKYNGLSNGTKKMKGRGAFLISTEEETKQFLAECNFNLARLTRNIIHGYQLTATVN